VLMLRDSFLELIGMAKVVGAVVAAEHIDEERFQHGLLNKLPLSMIKFATKQTD
jgi:hypothetical protein